MRSIESHCLALEPLEPRTLLSGNVTAVVTGGNLVITGDNGSNDIIVHEFGIQPGFYVQTGGSPTTINGGAGPAIFNNVTGDVRVDLGDGNDTVLVHHANVPRSLRIRSEDAGVQDVTIGRDLLYTGTDGDDSLLCDTVTTGGRLRADLGDGTGEVAIMGGSTVGGQLRIDGGHGKDSVGVEDSQIIGPTILNLLGGENAVAVGTSTLLRPFRYIGGPGDDSGTFTATDITGSLFFDGRGGDNNLGYQGSGGNAILQGNLIYKGRDGDDGVGVMIAQITGKFDATLGAGTNAATIGFAEVVGNVKIVGKGGDDEFNLLGGLRGNVLVDFGGGDNNGGLDGGIDGSLTVRGRGGDDVWGFNALSALHVDGPARFFLGNGNNSLTGDDNVFGGSIACTAGAGTDTVTLTDPTIGGSATFRLGDGNNTLSLTESNLGSPRPIAGSLVVATGDDADTLTIGECAIGGAANLKLGPGDDVMTVDRSTFGGSMRLDMGSGVNTTMFNGSPADNITIGGSLWIGGRDGTDAIDINYTQTAGAATFVLNGGENTLRLERSPVGRALTASMGDADDVFEFNHADIGGSATVRTGDGDSNVEFNAVSPTQTTIGGRLSIFGGDGRDVVTVDDTRVVQGTKAALGDGDNEWKSTRDDFNGALTVLGGNGSDELTLNTVDVAGKTTLNPGDGSYDLDVDKSAFHAAAVWKSNNGAGKFAVDDSTFGGAATLSLGSGGHDVTLVSNIFAGTFALRTTDGVDDIAILDSRFQGTALLDTGRCADVIGFDNVTGNHSEFQGFLTVRTGRGDDSLAIGLNGDPTAFTDILGGALLDGETSTDFLLAGIGVGNNGGTYVGVVHQNWEVIC